MRLLKSTYGQTCPLFKIKVRRASVSASYFAVMLCLFSALTCRSQDASQHAVDPTAFAVVGKIDDNFEVTSSGQVSYEIPFKVPTGTGGMEPKVGICYNGSKRTGLCGVGFDLTGLSVINRAPANMHVDGRAGVVNVDADDRLMLDGQRLIPVADLGGGRKEWRTEHDNYSRIISQEGDSLGPYSFTIQTKSGLTYHYDAEDSPRADRNNPSGTSQRHFLFWLLRRVEDTSGNYYTVTYGTDNRRGEYWPVRIDYTGNDRQGLSPYASLRFEYGINPDSTVTYIGGLRVRRCHLLSRVEAYCGDVPVRRYELSYQTVNNHRQLVGVTERGTDGRTLKPTTFTWHNTANEASQPVTSTGLSTLVGAKLVTGDFNGDGLTDIFAYAEDSDNGWSGWRVFLGDGAGMTLAASGVFYKISLMKPKQVLSGDINGDGLDDIVVKMYGRHYSYSSSNFYDMDVYLSSLSSAGYQLSPHSRAYYSSDSFTLHAAHVSSSSAGYDNTSFIMTFDGTKNGRLWYGEYSSLPFTTSNKAWHDVRVSDFDGDGMSDIANRVGDYIYFMTTDGTSMEFHDVPIRHTVGGCYFYVGDFNGDGKSDLFQINGYGAETMCYSTGNFRFEQELIYQDGWLPDAFRYDMHVADLDGDGRDDVYRHTVSQFPTLNDPQAYLNRNDGLRFVDSATGIGTGSDEFEQTAGDFNGDGKTDIMRKTTSDNSSQSCRIYYSPAGANNLLASVTDGLGNVTDIEYRCMTDTTVHTRGNTNTGSIGDAPYSRSFSASWPLVSCVTTPDGIGNNRSTVYRYHNALLHKRGRGVMGFEQTTIFEEATGTETVTHYRVQPQEFIMTPDRHTVRVNGHLVEETEMTDTLVYHHDHVFSIQPKESTTWKYEYNTGELVAQTSTRQEFDNHGNVTRMVTETPYKTVTNINTYADDTTRTASSSRWLLGRLASTTVTKCGGNDTLTLHSAFDYDTSTGLLIREAIEPEDPQLGSSKTYTRDGFGNIVRSVHRTNAASSQQRVTESLYDDKGRFISVTVNALGDTTRTVHDPLLGVPVVTVGANNDTTTYSYDGFGNLLTTITPLDTTHITMTWSAFYGGIPRYEVTRQSTGQPATVTYYDALGRKMSTKIQDMDGGWTHTRTVYDHQGRVARTSEPYRNGQTICWNVNEYDSVGRVICQTDPAGNSYTMAYSGLTTVTTDPLGRSTTKTVDMEGNLLCSRDALDGTVQYEYDLNGHCTAVIGSRTTIVTEFNKMGQRTRLVDPDLGETTYLYNGFGELIRQSSHAQNTDYTYDKLGRVKWETMPDYIIMHSYDSQWVGEVDMVSTTGNNGGIQYTRDEHGRVTTQTEYILGQAFVTEFTYNALNQLECITYPNGMGVRNVYTPTGYLKQVRDAGTGALYWQADSTDARGQLERFTLGNGLVTTVTHNAARGHIERITTAGVQDFSYTFNEVGCLTGRTDNLRSLQETFAYDDLDRLTEVAHSGTVVQCMTYDAAGNVTSKTGVGTQIGYVEGTNRVSYIRGANYVPVQWDQIRYTSFNKVSYVASGSSTLQLTYGWDRRRKLAVNTVDGTTTRRYYAGKYYEQEERGDTVRQTCYLYGSEGLFALVVRTDGRDSVRYCHRDHLGSVIGYSDETGQLVQELSYDAWGRRRDPGTWAYLPTLASAGALDPHGFTGHEHLDLLEMVNMDGRIYDPVLGRFLSPDPLVQAPDFSQSLNRYAYCLNNPLSLTDPTGYSWFSRNWKSLLASIVGIAAAAFTGGASVGLTVAIVAGAAGGAAGAMVGSILNGQNFGQILKSTFQGALFGAVSGALNFACGGIPDLMGRLVAHSLTDGFMEGVQGGNVLHGAMMGLLSAGTGEGLMALGGSLKTGAKLAVQSVVGGTLSELGGGNFANGAITAAFSFLFNHTYHQRTFEEKSSVFVQVPLDENAPLKGVYLYAKAYVIMTRLGKDMLLDVIGNTSYAPLGDDGDFISAMSATLRTNGKSVQTKYLKLDSSSSYIHVPHTSPKGSTQFLVRNPEQYKHISIEVNTSWIYSSNGHYFTPINFLSRIVTFGVGLPQFPYFRPLVFKIK